MAWSPIQSARPSVPTASHYTAFRSRERRHASTKIVPVESRVVQTPAKSDISSPVGWPATERQVMRSKSDHAWSMAAQCAKLAQQAEQKDEHDFFIRMRDCWIT